MITVYDNNTTLEDLREIPVVRPDNAGATWMGMQHGELVDGILDDIALRGWQTTDMKFSTARDGADLVGAIGVLPTGSEIDTPAGIGFGVGFMTSNARRKALRMYVGGTVAVCHNGLATGSIVLQKKHSVRTDLAAEIEAAMDKYTLAAAGMAGMVARLQEKPIDAPTASDLLAQAGERDLMPRKYLWDVSREFHRPSHPEHGTGTAWTLVNAFTEIVKRNPPTRQLHQMDAFQRLVLAA
jgi:hypothetical protein